MLSHAKKLRVKKVDWLCSYQNENIWKDEDQTRSPNQTDQKIGSLDGAEMVITKGYANGNVALNCHAGQIKRSVVGCEDGNNQHNEAEGCIDCVKGIADDVEKSWQEQLDHVIYHQVDEQNVTRVWIEDLKKGKKKSIDRVVLAVLAKIQFLKYIKSGLVQNLVI